MEAPGAVEGATSKQCGEVLYITMGTKEKGRGAF
jgi:hypothetical protein